MWYKFTAYNSESQYGYGSISEAEYYCEYLNRDREINLYSIEECSEEDEEYIERYDCGFNLTCCLNEMYWS